MRTHDLIQGSPQWLAYRATMFNASDAAAMLGLSPHKTRSRLLHEMHTGLSRDPGSYVQERVLDPGHQYEAQARPLAEFIVGESLYPVVGSEGRLSASFDGLTMGEDVAFEHKTLSEELAACMPSVEGHETTARMIDLPAHHCVQMEQQLMVSGAQRVLFMASKWNGETLVEERHCWYEPDLELRARIVAGWAQFAADLDAYAPPEDVAPAPVGKAPETLPALRIEVTGQVTASNLAEFKQTALAAIRSVNRELKTDGDFADAESAVKWCGDVESRLAAAKEHALSQTASIDALFKTIDDISAEARQVRLDLEKLVKARKESIKGEIVAGGVSAWRDHLTALNTRLGQNLMPHIPADFAGVIKNKRTVTSLRDAVDTELARAKIAANEIADRITLSLRKLAEHDAHRALFPDTASLVVKAPDDLAAVIASRIAAHEAKEAARMEAERARIRAEEQARADREAAAMVAEQMRVQAVQRDREEAERMKILQYEQDRLIAASEAEKRAHAAELERNALALKAKLEDPSIRAAFVASHPAPAVVPIRPAAPAAIEVATLKLAEINERLGVVTVNAADLEALGIPVRKTDRTAKLYFPSDLLRICDAIVQHLGTVVESFENSEGAAA